MGKGGHSTSKEGKAAPILVRIEYPGYSLHARTGELLGAERAVYNGLDLGILFDVRVPELGHDMPIALPRERLRLLRAR